MPPKTPQRQDDALDVLHEIVAIVRSLETKILRSPEKEPLMYPQTEPSHIREYHALPYRDQKRQQDHTIELIDGWIKNQISDNTARSYRTVIRNFFIYVNRPHPKYVTRRDILDWKRSWDGTVSTNTLVQRIHVIKSFFRFCREDGAIRWNPTLGLRVPRRQLIGSTPELTDAEAERMLSAPDTTTPKGQRDQLILELLFRVGMRAQELLDIQVRDIYVSRDLPVVRLKGKGGRSRTVAIPNRLYQKILAYTDAFNYAPDHYLFNAHGHTQKTVPQNKERPMSHHHLLHLFTHYARLAGIDHKVTPHSARVTVAGRAIDMGCDLGDIAAQMGWAGLRMVSLYDRRRGALRNSPALSLTYGSELQEATILSEIEAPTRGEPDGQ